MHAGTKNGMKQQPNGMNRHSPMAHAYVTVPVVLLTRVTTCRPQLGQRHGQGLDGMEPIIGWLVMTAGTGLVTYMADMPLGDITICAWGEPIVCIAPYCIEGWNTTVG